jgi:hypothetical protein
MLFHRPTRLPAHRQSSGSKFEGDFSLQYVCVSLMCGQADALPHQSRTEGQSFYISFTSYSAG